jgi:predicted alpha/beta hydrolase
VLAAAAEDHGPMVATAIKFGAMAVASTVIWLGRKKRSILAMSLVAVVVFGWLVAYHAGTLRGLGWL